MSAIKIAKFLGQAPKLAGELLPDTVAQYSFNVKLYSGDLIPYTIPEVVSSLEKTGPITSIYPMMNGTNRLWLHWTTDVDVAKGPIASDTTQRIYYTGDSEPRVTNFTLATSGGGASYPIGYYTLGLPAPTVAVTAALGGGGAGAALARTYVYTWLTLWDEESQPSPVSNSVNAMEGQTVNITGLPVAGPVGQYQTTGMVKRLYRAVTTGAGTFYFKVADIAMGTAVYADTIATAVLVTFLPSQDWDAPNANMIGIIALPNGMMAGFFDNNLCFCEPYQPHAWPIKYRLTTDSDIVAIASVGTSIVVATEGNPYVFTGNSPADVTSTRLDIIYPCVAKRSMVNMGFGAVYASRAGLVVISQSGNDLLTKYVHYWDTWQASFDITHLTARYYDGKYFAAHDTGSFIFERDEQIGGYFVESNYQFTAAYYDPLAALFFFALGQSVLQWDPVDGVRSVIDWKSKVFKTADMVNFGAARVVGDWEAADSSAAIAANNAIIISNQNTIINELAAGSINSVAFNESYEVNGSLIEDLNPIDNAILFQLYTDKIIRFQRYINNSEVFRLPSGYKTDTFEVRVSGNVQVRAIHLAETPLGLKGV